MKSNLDKDEVKSSLDLLFNSKTENQLIERDALMLQANYLSEIERIARENGINRKDIASRIKTSPSYLTQVFRGDKPLNFITLAKIKRALNLRFDVKAALVSENKMAMPTQIIEFKEPNFNDNFDIYKKNRQQFIVSIGNKTIEQDERIPA